MATTPVEQEPVKRLTRPPDGPQGMGTGCRHHRRAGLQEGEPLGHGRLISPLPPGHLEPDRRVCSR
jgi:hypothetical protein